MRKTDLALRALVVLDQPDATIQAADLAETLHSTRQFIPQVLAPLVRVGWITSIPGPHGGYRLSADLQKTSLLDVIELMEGPTDDGTCVLGGDCAIEVPCVAHQAWIEARGALLERLAATPIAAVHANNHSKPRAKGPRT